MDPGLQSRLVKTAGSLSRHLKDGTIYVCPVVSHHRHDQFLPNKPAWDILTLRSNDYDTQDNYGLRQRFKQVLETRLKNTSFTALGRGWSSSSKSKRTRDLIKWRQNAMTVMQEMVYSHPDFQRVAWQPLTDEELEFYRGISGTIRTAESQCYRDIPRRNRNPDEPSTKPRIRIVGLEPSHVEPSRWEQNPRGPQPRAPGPSIEASSCIEASADPVMRRLAGLGTFQSANPPADVNQWLATVTTSSQYGEQDTIHEEFGLSMNAQAGEGSSSRVADYPAGPTPQEPSAWTPEAHRQAHRASTYQPAFDYPSEEGSDTEAEPAQPVSPLST